MKKLLIYILVLTALLIHGQDSLTKKWFQIGLNIALIGNNSYSNIYGSERQGLGPRGVNTSETILSKPFCYGSSFGLETVLGKNSFIKQLVGLNYEQTNSYFNYKYEFLGFTGHGSSYYYFENLNKKRNTQILNINYGLKLQYKSVSTGLFAAYNFVLLRTDIQNGFIKQSNGTIFPDSIVISDKKVISKRDTGFASVRLRIAYDLRIKKQSFSIFLMRNFNILNIITPEHTYLAPWYYFGLQWFPGQSRKKTI